MSSRWIDASEGRSKHNCKWSDEITTYQEKEKQLRLQKIYSIQNRMRQWLNILITLHYIYLWSDRCIIALSAMIILCVVSITWQHQDHSRLTADRCGSTGQSEARSDSLWPIRSRHRASVWSDVRGEREQVLQHLLIAFIHEVLKTISQCRPIIGGDCDHVTNERQPLYTSAL